MLLCILFETCKKSPTLILPNILDSQIANPFQQWKLQIQTIITVQANKNTTVSNKQWIL